MQRKTFIQTLALPLMAAGALLAGTASVHAQAPVELQFYYPVAVGGPIAKTIDGFAAGFMKENPGVKVSPIYAGTVKRNHQDSRRRGAEKELYGDPSRLLAVMVNTR